MPENEKKNGVLSLFMGVFKNKKEDCADIVTQAERVVSDYILKRRNEIIDKYCKKTSPRIIWFFLGLGITGLVIGLVL